MKKIRKINKDWMQIDVEVDNWDIPTVAVAIYRTEYGEWSVCDGDYDIGSQVHDFRRYVFLKLKSAKAFAQDLAIAIKNETAYPRFSGDKYDL